jgi:GcrA cell cycle regulator
MSWDAKDVALLKKLWAVGQSAAQIARRVGCSRNAVCGRLTRLGLKRGHKPPTAKPKIRPVPKRRPALLAACARPVAKNVSRKTVGRQPKKFSKRELYAMLADAVRNTGWPAHRDIVAALPPHLVQFERFPYCRQSPMHLNVPWRHQAVTERYRSASHR